MKAQVQKWGNSLAIRIPKPLAEDSRLSQGSEVELSVEEGRLIVSATSSWSNRLDALLAQITPENCHPEIDFGPAVGNEFW